MQSSNAARAFVGTISKLGQPAGPSARFNVVKLWGSGKATPRQYQTFAVAATNPAGVVKALDRFRASETGQSSPGDVMLLALRAGVFLASRIALLCFTMTAVNMRNGLPAPVRIKIGRVSRKKCHVMQPLSAASWAPVSPFSVIRIWFPRC